ncbi:hypothetical protein M405DRAFT_596975 [Rhizopogon salebrosus TDB-379]|nr:hypothetical protein M405DRAFT_596975 [Rhizopogon salebrosus TDB-379]
MGITLGEVALIGLFLETLLYAGVLLTLYWLTLFVLLKKSGIQRQLLIPVLTLLFCIATAHLIINFIRALEAFIFQADTIGANAYYSNLASPLELAKMAFYITQTVLADSVILWRCYVLYNKSLSIVVPGCAVLLTNGAIGSYVVWILSQVDPEPPAFADRWLNSFYILTITISSICSILIAWRIYRTRRFMPGGVTPFLPIVIVVVESGALYATSVLALLVTLFTEYGVQCAVLDIVVPIVGINFCLVILQVHFYVGSGKPPIEQPVEQRDILSRGQGETEIVQSDVMDRKNQLFWGCGYQL